ncbi:MAG: sigma-70 family RNA polymerase sigma factor [Bacteroidales bacterium]|nr:sigma-70 family RNA polymerase sigma factor [Bacteroidales bacterium]
MKRFHNFTDRDLVSGIISRDERIIEKIYKLYYQSIRFFVIKNNGTDDDAWDVFQNAILILFQKFRDDSFKLTCSLKTYLHSIARIVWLRELKKRKKGNDRIVLEEELPDAASDVSEIYERNERLALYRSVLEKMSGNCQRVLNLHYEGRSIREITHIMGFRNEQHTRNRIYRCKLTLTNRIQATYGYQELRNEKVEDD